MATQDSNNYGDWESPDARVVTRDADALCGDASRAIRDCKAMPGCTVTEEEEETVRTHMMNVTVASAAVGRGTMTFRSLEHLETLTDPMQSLEVWVNKLKQRTGKGSTTAPGSSGSYAA